MQHPHLIPDLELLALASDPQNTEAAEELQRRRQMAEMRTVSEDAQEEELFI